MSKIYIPSKEFAELSGCPLKTIRDMCKRGQLPHQKMNEGYYIHVTKALAILEKMAESNMRQQVVAKAPEPKSKVVSIAFDKTMSFAEKLEELKRRNKEECKARAKKQA